MWGKLDAPRLFSSVAYAFIVGWCSGQHTGLINPGSAVRLRPPQQIGCRSEGLLRLINRERCRRNIRITTVGYAISLFATVAPIFSFPREIFASLAEISQDERQVLPSHRNPLPELENNCIFAPAKPKGYDTDIHLMHMQVDPKGPHQLCHVRTQISSSNAN